MRILVKIASKFKILSKFSSNFNFPSTENLFDLGVVKKVGRAAVIVAQRAVGRTNDEISPADGLKKNVPKKLILSN